MTLRIYNTLSKSIGEFGPIDPPTVKIYTCGPTVYDRVTVGNLRTYIFADLFIRVLSSAGFEVTAVQNITDVGHLYGDRDAGEDKLTLQAQKSGKSAWEIAEEFTKLYFEDRRKLLLLEPSIWAYATKHINEQIEFIKKLEKKGFSYLTSDGIYFDTSKVKKYGKLAGLDIGHLIEGARVEINHEKKNPTDFALWKFSPKDKKRDMEWDSPWGVGFPGWHIECSAMSLKYLGEEFDIHTGGVDFIPLHHTNEIAQNEALTGKVGARFWMHGEFLTVDGGRMGKSLGNGYTLDDLASKGFSPLDFKYFTYSAHYRQKLNFTWEALGAAQTAHHKIINILAIWTIDPSFEKSGPDAVSMKTFNSAVWDDLNMPKALAVLWGVISSKDLKLKTKVATVLEMDKVFGLGLEESAKAELWKKKNIPENVQKLINKRNTARQTKDFEKSDELRNEIEKLGFKINDETSK